MATILKENFPDYKISNKEIGFCPIKLASYFDRQVKLLVPMWRRVIKVDNTLSRTILGIEYRDHVETLVAMAETLIATGQVRDKRKRPPTD